MCLFSGADQHHVIVDCFGGDQLHTISLDTCWNIDLYALLLPHKQIEYLRIEECDLVRIQDADEFAEHVPAAVISDISNQFLPNLKKLETLGTCLGQWSRLFECHRPLMTDVTLNCFHFGLPTLSRFNWSDIPELWPNLRQLKFSDGPSTLNALRFIVPLLNEFHHLENFIVPRNISLSLEIVGLLTFDILEQTGHSSIPIGLNVQTVSLYPCSNCLCE